MGVPIWLLGRHVTAVQAILQTIDAAGTLADSLTGTDTADLVESSGASWPAVTITQGLIDGVDLQASKVTENINSVTRTRAHHVPTARRDQITLTEILRTGADACLLANLWFSATADTAHICKVTLGRGGNKWTFYGVMVDYGESFSRGKNVGRLTLQMVDPGAENAAYAAGVR